MEFDKKENAEKVNKLKSNFNAYSKSTRDRCYIVYVDEGFDALGRRSFFIDWIVESSGRFRSQCFFARPDVYIVAD